MDIFSQFAGWGTQALAVILGVIFIVHGYAKAKNPNMMAPFWWGSTTIAFLHGLAEVAAGLMVIVGIGVEYAALFMIVIMLGAIYNKIFTWKTAFWSQNSTGWEFDLLILAGALVLLLG